jgi:hypothetical protein
MMVMILGKATAQSEAGELGSPEDFAAMNAFNEQLVEAGIVLAGDGLQPSSKGKRVSFDRHGRPTVVDGPFAETKEVVAGYGIWEVGSIEEAVEWVKRSPLRDSEVEIRKILDASDFGPELAGQIAEAEARGRQEAAGPSA